MFTVASDAFPSRAVGSVVGFGCMCGGIGGMLMLLVAGGMLQWLDNFTPLFIFAGVMHPLAWIAIRALMGKNITQIDLDKGLRLSAASLGACPGAGPRAALWGCAQTRLTRGVLGKVSVYEARGEVLELRGERDESPRPRGRSPEYDVTSSFELVPQAREIGATYCDRTAIVRSYCS
jgi:hypothetical protein